MRALALAAALVIAGCGSVAAKTAVTAPTHTAQVLPSSTPAPSSSQVPAATVEPSDTPPPGMPGYFALEFQLKLVGSANPGDTFQVSFHPPGSPPGRQVTFVLCPTQSDTGSTGPGGPCRAGATYAEGGGFQPAGSSIAYSFVRASSSGGSQVIAQGVAQLNMNEALVVSYPESN